MDDRPRSIYNAKKAEDKEPGTCEGFYGPCGKPGIWRKQMTSYPNDDLNYRCLCDNCQEESNEYWFEQWEEAGWFRRA